MLWWTLIILNSVLIVAPTVGSLARGKIDIFDCRHIMMLYMWLQFCLWPAWVMIAGYTTFYTIRIRFIEDYSTTTTPALLLVTLATVCFNVGFYGTSRSLSSRLAAGLKVTLGSTPKVCLTITYIVFGIVGTLAGAAFLRAYGGLEMILHIDEFRTKSLAGTGPYLTGLNLLSFAFLLAALNDAIRGRLSAVSVALFLLATSLSLLCGFRHMFVATVLFLALVYHYGRNRIRLNPRFIAIAGAFIGANFLYVSFRSTGNVWQLFTEPDNVSTVLWNGFFCRFHGLESLVRIIHFTPPEDRLGVGPAIQNLLNSFVPRKLFPDKPISLGIIGNLKFYGDIFTENDTGACVPTLLGDLYWVGGPLAICIGTTLLGSIARIAKGLANLSRGDVLGFVLYAQIFVFFFFVNEDLFLHSEQLIHRCVLIFAPLLGLTSSLKRASRPIAVFGANSA